VTANAGSPGALPIAAFPGDPHDDAYLERLLADAAPIVRKVVSQRLRTAVADRDDVCSQVLLDLMLHMRDPRTAAPERGDAFENYVAAAAHHGCDHYLRRRYPLRWRLRNRMRYLLERDPTLAIWKPEPGVWTCGLAGTEADAPGVPPAPHRLTVSDPRRLRDLLLQVFRASGGPLPLTTVVDLTASVLGIPFVAESDAASIEQISDPAPSAHATLEHRQGLAHAWEHIQELPLRQRHALLLNLKNDSIALFLVTGVATLQGLAHSLELSTEEMAELWNRLPLADNDIAGRLGCTRQQVINLRMAARKRLANRLAGWS
jgi:hypothetical protein